MELKALEKMRSKYVALDLSFLVVASLHSLFFGRTLNACSVGLGVGWDLSDGTAAKAHLPHINTG